jgi:multidrug efflux pump subunit AcrA (membrane-fusion protein)
MNVGLIQLRNVPAAVISVSSVISVISVIAFLVPNGGCSDRETARAGTKPTTAPATVATAPVKVDEAQRTVDVTGTLYGDEEATISAKVAGRVVAVFHDVGDRVTPGQPLAQIETRDYELARSQRQLAMRESLAKLGLSAFPEGEFNAEDIPTVRKAKLEAQNAEARFNRGKQLYEQQPPRLSEQEYQDLQTAWEVARNEYQVQVLTAQSALAQARAREAELAMAEQQLADTAIRAPAELTQPAAAASTTAPAMRGAREYAVSERMCSVGEYVNSAAPLFRLVDDDPIKLRASVPERFSGEVQVGQGVHVHVEAFAEPFVGKVTRINPQVDPTNRNFRVEALIDNPRRTLKPGAFARASIETRREPGVIFVPGSAVVSFAGVSRVYVNENGSAAERIVELGDRRGDEVEVRKGLKSADVVVTRGGEKLVPGTPLNVQP